MAEPAPLLTPDEPLTGEAASRADATALTFRARRALFKRLADVVCLPSSRVNAFERSMVGDLLVEMLRETDTPDRARVARRIAGLTEAPASLVRLLLRDEVAVAGPLLEEGHGLSDSDLIECCRTAGPEHRRLIAARRHVAETVCEALVEAGEPEVIETLLRNPGARLSTFALEAVMAQSRHHDPYVAGLLRRPELRPAQAYVMFWWADPDARALILTRFAVGREAIQEVSADVFALAAAEGWQDPLVRKALQFIERRQRNRAALSKSAYESLEAAVAAAEQGLTREIASEIAYLSGLKPTTGAKILTDLGGEPLAILCKATGLPKWAIHALWRGLRRPETDSETGALTRPLERTLITYDRMAVDRAQTVLRYWNWSLSSALTPALVQAIRTGDEQEIDPFSAPQRAAMLALASDFGRK